MWKILFNAPKNSNKLLSSDSNDTNKTRVEAGVGFNSCFDGFIPSLCAMFCAYAMRRFLWIVFSFACSEGVEHEHADRHGPYSTRNRGYGAAYF